MLEGIDISAHQDRVAGMTTSPDQAGLLRATGLCSAHQDDGQYDCPICYTRDHLLRAALAATGDSGGPDETEIETVSKALAIGRISYGGDSWFAKDAGYDYDDAEKLLDDALLIWQRLAARLRDDRAGT